MLAKFAYMSNANNIQNRCAGSDSGESPLSREELLSLTELAKKLPRINHKRPAVSTLWRWCINGVGGVHLEHFRRGRVIASSVPAVNRFSAALADTLVVNQERRAIKRVVDDYPKPRSAARQRRAQAAMRRLAEAGI